jgi:hypothetical protein
LRLCAATTWARSRGRISSSPMEAEKVCGTDGQHCLRDLVNCHFYKGLGRQGI